MIVTKTHALNPTDLGVLPFLVSIFTLLTGLASHRRNLLLRLELYTQGSTAIHTIHHHNRHNPLLTLTTTPTAIGKTGQILKVNTAL